MVLSQGAILSGTVVDAAGVPVEGAELIDATSSGHFVSGAALLGSGREALAVTGPDGSFRVDELACGHWSIRVRHDKQPSKTFEGNADIPGAEVSGLEFRLAAGDSIAGRVVGLPEDVGPMTVRARVVDREGGMLAGFRPGSSRTTECGPGGNFLLEGLEDGLTYDLQVRKSRSPSGPGVVVFGGGARSDTVRARAGDRGVELLFSVGATIVLRTLDAKTGAPVTALRVSSEITWSSPVRDEDGRVKREFEDGRVEIADLFPRGKRSRVSVKITSTGFYDWEREDIEIVLGQRIDLGDVRLEPAPVVVVNVFDDASGAPVEGARVTLRPRPEAPDAGSMSMSFNLSIGDDDEAFVETGGSSRQATTDENGVAVLSSLEGEEAVLRVESGSHAPFELKSLFLPPGARVERDVRVVRAARWSWPSARRTEVRWRVSVSSIARRGWTRTGGSSALCTRATTRPMSTERSRSSISRRVCTRFE